MKGFIIYTYNSNPFGVYVYYNIIYIVFTLNTYTPLQNTWPEMKMYCEFVKHFIQYDVYIIVVRNRIISINTILHGNNIKLFVNGLLIFDVYYIPDRDRIIYCSF